MSLCSEVTDFVFENGRRYHAFKEGRYPFPNDESEQEREKLFHSLFVNLLDGQLHLSPLEKPRSVLDLGTGVGRWPLCMGHEYKNASIVGLDISPHQTSYLPANVSFLIDDVEATWPNAPESLDFVFSRNMATAIRDWKSLFAEAFQAIAPGGWLEVQDIQWIFTCRDGSIPNHWAPCLFFNKVREGLLNLGIDMNASAVHPQYTEVVGFTNLSQIRRPYPVGGWPRDPALKAIGKQIHEILTTGLHAIAVGPLTRGLGWSSDQVNMLIADTYKALQDPSVHALVYFNCLYAQKPI
ncbi:S-adenosyl-L-methionine-dependent methyltransferase [Mariannaea sp. PMI_226]|nr:S-adenosyl-L-methionine-dependent methyltransferase [Mariannaea sp. PMI_226]